MTKQETKQLLQQLGVNPFLIANTLAGGDYVDYIKNVKITKVDDDNYEVSECR